MKQGIWFCCLGVLWGLSLLSCGGSSAPQEGGDSCGGPCIDCQLEPVAIPADAGLVADVLVDTENLYIETKREDSKGHYYGVYKIPLDGRAPTQLWSDFHEHTDVLEAPPEGFELAHGSIYLLGEGGGRILLDSGELKPFPPIFSRRPVFVEDGMIVVAKGKQWSIVKISPSGELLEVLYELGAQGALSLARAGEVLFWVQYELAENAYYLYRGGLDGRPAEKIFGPVGGVSPFSFEEIAADERFVYFFDTQSRLMRVSHDGQQASVLADSATSLRSLGECTFAARPNFRDSGVYVISEKRGAMTKVAGDWGISVADERFLYVIHNGELGRVPRQR